MIFKKVEPKGYQGCNSYILSDDGKTAVVIDPTDEVIAALAENALVCKYVLLTHGHFDHVGVCGLLYEKGAAICCGEREKDFIFSAENRGIFGGVYIPDFRISKTFSDGEEFGLCGIKFKALSTPGHTAGGMTYLCKNFMFSGDTLFAGSVGRTDLPTGDYGELMASIKKLFALSGDYIVCTGHGDNTTLDDERKFNPYVR